MTLSLPVFRSGLSQPVLATNAGDGTNRVYVVEKAGRIKVLSASGGYLGTLLNITDRTSKGGEQGLLGLAFHPNYESNLQVLRLLHGPRRRRAHRRVPLVLERAGDGRRPWPA